MLVTYVKCFKSKHTMELKHFSEMMQPVLHDSQFHEIKYNGTCSKDLQTKKMLLSNNEHKRQLMSLLKFKLYYNTNALELEKQHLSSSRGW